VPPSDLVPFTFVLTGYQLTLRGVIQAGVRQSTMTLYMQQTSHLPGKIGTTLVCEYAFV
jgi:hypothetical protein